MDNNKECIRIRLKHNQQCYHEETINKDYKELDLRNWALESVFQIGAITILSGNGNLTDPLFILSNPYFIGKLSQNSFQVTVEISIGFNSY